MKARSPLCSSCGAALTENVSRATANGSPLLARALCTKCRVVQALQRDMVPLDECPRCQSTNVLRTPGPEREEILVCPDCDYIWVHVHI
jgi:hypothetical protein